jgi:hypothetical protein
MNLVKEARNLIAFVLDDGNNDPIIFCTHGIGGFIAKVVSFYLMMEKRITYIQGSHLRSSCSTFR